MDEQIVVPHGEAHTRLQLRLLADEQFGAQLREVEIKSSGMFPAGWSEHPGYREVVAWPATFSRTRFSRDALREALAEAAGKNRALAFLPHVTERHISAMHDGYEHVHTVTEDGRDQAYVHWQVRRSGLVYNRCGMPEDLAYGSQAPHMSVDATVACITGAVDFLGRYYEALVGGDEEIAMRVRITATEGRRLSPTYRSDDPEATCSLSEIVYETTRPVHEMRSKRAQLVTEMTRDVLQQCNWVDPPLKDLRAVVDNHVTGAIYRHRRPATV